MRNVVLATTFLSTLVLGGHNATASFFMVDEAEDLGLLQSDWSFSANVADFDGNGFQDVMIARHEHTSVLYRNLGDRFVTHKIFQTADHHDCAWGDVNVDGALDLYCTIGADTGDGIGLNELWIQNPSTRTFTNRALAYNVQDPFGRGRRATFVNLNNDPYPDLFVGNDFPRPDGRPTPNKFFLNIGGARFEARTAGVTKEVGANCAETGDYDNDGWEDLLVCGKSRVFLYHNEQGTTFKEKANLLNVKGGARDAEFANINGDAYLDIVRINATAVSVQYGTASGVFQAPDVLETLGAGREVAVGDANGDNRNDIYVLTGGRALDSVLLSNGSSFQEIGVPPAASGNGDTVEPIDYDANGLMDFIALNGGNKTVGPNQLLTLSDDPTEPDAPRITNVEEGSGAVCLDWSNPWNGGSTLTGYNLYRDGNLIAELGKVRSYRDTAVVDNTTYEYRVTALNAIGESAKSEPVSATPSIMNILDCRQ